MVITQGTIRIDDLTEEQIQFCQAVMDVYNTFLTDYPTQEDFEETVFSGMVLTPLQETVSAAFDEIGTDESPFISCYQSGGSLVVRPTLRTWQACDHHSTKMFRMFDLAWDVAFTDRENLSQMLANDLMLAIKDGKVGHDIIFDVSPRFGKRFAEFFANFMDTRWKRNIAKAGSSVRVLETVRKLYASDYFGYRTWSYDLGDRHILLAEIESFNPSFGAVLVQELLRAMKLERTIIFTYADYEDDFREEFPSGEVAGGLVIVDHTDWAIIDARGMAENVYNGLDGGILHRAGFGHRNAEAPWMCPQCKSHDITGAFAAQDGWALWQKYGCEDCQAEWINVAPVLTQMILDEGEYK